MRPINVSVADVNQQRRAAMEHVLQQDRQNFSVLIDVLSRQSGRVIERRLKSRKNITLIEDNLARINRLEPKVLFVNVQLFLDADCMFFVLLRRQCPEILVILLTEETTKENEILQALASGVCGFVSHKSNLVELLKATKAVEHGEAWVPRKLLGKIMRKILVTSHKTP